MAARTLSAAIRCRLYAFAADLATPFTDSRRAAFVADMVPGLVIANHVHLTKVARALSDGANDIHGVEKRLSRHLSSEHWDMSPLTERLLADSAALVSADSLLVADLTDLAKPHARKLEGLGRVHDGSDPDKRLVRGYAVLGAYVRVGRWQLFPLLLEPLKTYAGAPTSENAEILAGLLRVHEAVGRKGTWVLDRGFDRRELYTPLVRQQVAFVVRQLGTRSVRTADGHTALVSALAEATRPAALVPPRGRTFSLEVELPEVGAEGFLLVVHWRRWCREPLVLLVSPRARRRGRRAAWFVRAYLRRWGVEDETRAVKQAFMLEAFLVRSWRALVRLLVLVGWALWWLNLWGDPGWEGWLEALREHPWRLPKPVVYLVAWIATLIHFLLHPRPRIPLPPQ